MSCNHEDAAGELRCADYVGHRREALPHQHLLERGGRRVHRRHPRLGGLLCLGATAEEALREVEIAKAAWLEAARAEGRCIPQPRYRPAIYQATR